MLQIVIPPTELWDEFNQEFVMTKEYTLQLEHSLVSLSKWESKWRKPFLSKQDKTYEEILDYIKDMTITPNVEPEAYDYLTMDNIEQINKYISDSMTATTISNRKPSRSSGEQVTSELIYYWMIALNVPFECQYWHLNRLLTLIEVCNVKNQPPKKMSKRDILRRNASLNAARRQQYNSKG